MTVLFGSVEYFETEFLNVAAQKHLNPLNHDHISMIYSILRSEWLEEFVCEENIRLECLENLTQAFIRLNNSEMLVTAE